MTELPCSDIAKVQGEGGPRWGEYCGWKESLARFKGVSGKLAKRGGGEGSQQFAKREAGRAGVREMS